MTGQSDVRFQKVDIDLSTRDFAGIGLRWLRHYSVLRLLGFHRQHKLGLTKHFGQTLTGFEHRFRKREMQTAKRQRTNRRPAGQLDGAGNLSAALAADRAFPVAVAELGCSA